MIKNLFTVSQINKYIKDVINAAFPQNVWICGEIQGYERSKNKNHIFFDLVEKDEQSETIVARISLVIFAGRKAYIERILNKSENAFQLTDDIEVKFSCKLDFYPPHGAMRLMVESIDPTYTLGKIAQQRQKVIALLKKQGVFDKNKKLPLPRVPLNIGLITSDDSAAYNDFISELQRSGYGFTVYNRNTVMQGAKCEKEVCKAIEELQNIDTVDVIVITRGGGSIADISDFDSQKIAEKVAAAKLPVMSGIGHEINTTITDMAAHTYAKTPTAIAHFLVSQVEEFLGNLDRKFEGVSDVVLGRITEERQQLKEQTLRLQSSTMDFLKDYNGRLIEITHSLKSGPFVCIRHKRQRLKDVTYHLQNSTKDFLKIFNTRLIEMTQTLKTRPPSLFREHYRLLADTDKELAKVVQGRVRDEKQKLIGYAKIVDIVHPINTIKRGFSITRSEEGKLIRSVTDLKDTKYINTELIGGEVSSEIQEIKEK